jgi:hypothetical protein
LHGLVREAEQTQSLQAPVARHTIFLSVSKGANSEDLGTFVRVVGNDAHYLQMRRRESVDW